MYILEIGGKAIAVIDAVEAQARAVFESAAFKQDLMVMTHQDTPLWDGTAPLHIRAASQQESSAWEAPRPELDGESPEDHGLSVVFLVPIDHDHEEVSGIPPELRT